MKCGAVSSNCRTASIRWVFHALWVRFFVATLGDTNDRLSILLHLGAMDANASAPARYDDREDRRRQLLWSGILQTARGPVQCIVVDISRGGARLTAAALVTVGQSVTLKVAGVGMFRGTVVWSVDGTIGVQFIEDKAATAA